MLNHLMILLSKLTRRNSASQEEDNLKETPNPYGILADKIRNGDYAIESKHLFMFKILYDMLEYFRKLGEKNGKIGYQNTELIQSLALNKANHCIELAKADIGGEIALCQHENNFLQQEMEVAQRNYKNHKEYNEFLNIHNKYTSNYFSWLLACIYFFIAFILIISDIVIALQLITIAFNFEVSTGTHLSLRNLFGSDDQIINIKVLLNFWQAVIISVGIALTSVYIKMFYDDYVGEMNGSNLIRYNSLKRIIQTDDKVETGKQLKSELKVKFIIKACIMIGVIILLILLAELRYHAEILKNPAFRHPTAKWAVFGMTLMFPVIAGICFSNALKIIQNKLHLLRSSRMLRKQRAILEKITRQYNTNQKIYLRFEKTLKYWDSEKIFEEIKSYFIGYYHFGFNAGILKPSDADEIKDIIKRVESLRSEASARMQFEHLKNKFII